jgi:mevalonate kinase
MVASVKSRQTAMPTVVNPIFESIGKITVCSEQLLKDLYKTQDIQARASIYDKLGDLIDTNHHLLNALGAGHDKLDEVCKIAKAKG